MPSSALRRAVSTSTPGNTQNVEPAASAASACSTDQVVPTPTDAAFAVPFAEQGHVVVRAGIVVGDLQRAHAILDEQVAQRHEELLGNLPQHRHDPVLASGSAAHGRVCRTSCADWLAEHRENDREQIR